MATRDADRDLVAALIAISEDRFPVPLLDDAGIRELLRSRPRIALVGASSNPARPSHGVMRSLRQAGYDVVAVNPRETEIDRHAVLPELSPTAVAATGPVDIVDVFRRADLCVEHAREAVAVGARCLWLQLGIANEEAGRIAHEAGLAVVMDRCTIVEHRRLGGLTAARPGILARPRAPAPERRAPGGPDAPDPPPRGARRLRARRPPARRSEPLDPDRGPLRRWRRGQPPGDLPSRPARVHRHGRRRPGLGPDHDDGRADDVDRGRGAADAGRDHVHPRGHHGRLRPHGHRRRRGRDGGRGQHGRRRRARRRRGDRPDRRASTSSSRSPRHRVRSG